MIDGNIDILNLEGDINSVVSLEGNLLPVGPKGDKGDPGFSPVVTTSKSGKTTTIQFETATGNVYAYIQDGEDGQGSGDMLTDVYDQNKNGIVDNAEKVNGKTVESNVPANAVFTDSNAVWGNITGTLSNQTDLQTALNAKADSSSVPSISDTYGTSTTNGYSQNYINNNSVNPNGNATSTTTGESISLSNTLEAPLKMQLKGNTKQTTYTGKNLLNEANISTSGASAGIKYNGNYVYSSNPNSDSRNWNYENSNYYLTLDSGTYTLSLKFKKRITNSYGGLFRFFKTDGTFIGNVNAHNVDNASVSITLTETTNLGLYFKLFDGEVNIMVEKNSTATSYEPYCGGIPSPNPSYPQDVQVVKGDNSIVVKNKNLFDKNSGIISNYYYSSTGALTSDTNYSSQTIYIKVKPNTKYTLSSQNGDLMIMCEYDSGKNFIGRNYKSPLVSSTTYTTGSTTEYIRVSFRNENINSFQLEVGSTATSYRPYITQTYPINLPVENLFDKDNANVLNGYFDTGRIYGSDTNRIVYVSCQPNTTYTISKVLGSRFQVAYSSSLPAINGSISGTIAYDDRTEISITTNDSAKYLVVYCWRYGETNTFDDVKESLQIETGSKKNAYTPYGTTPIELCKIGDYQDYFYKSDNKWYIHKEIGKVVLNGSEESWVFNNSGQTIKRPTLTFSSINNLSTNVGNIIALSYYFKGISYNDRNNYDNSIFSFCDNNNHLLCINSSNWNTLDAFKTWLSTHNTSVYYVLATPTNTEITETELIEQLDSMYDAYSYEDETNIEQINDDIPFIITAENYNDNYNGRYKSLLEMIKKAGE